MSCGVGCRHGSDPALLWLWCRLAATALIQPLVWKPPCAVGAALEKTKKKDKKIKIKKERKRSIANGMWKWGVCKDCGCTWVTYLSLEAREATWRHDGPSPAWKVEWTRLPSGKRGSGALGGFSAESGAGTRSITQGQVELFGPTPC